MNHRGFHHVVFFTKKGGYRITNDTRGGGDRAVTYAQRKINYKKPLVFLLFSLLLFQLILFLQVQIPTVKADTPDIEPEIIGFSSATNGTSCIFRVKWNATGSHFIFGTNNTGSWVNETIVAFTDKWSNTTKTLNANANYTVQWRVWANDTGDSWTNISPQNLTTVSVYSKGAITGYWSDIQNAVDDVEENMTSSLGNVYIPWGTFNFVNVGENWTTWTPRVIADAGVSIFGAETERYANDSVNEWRTSLILPYDMQINNSIWFQFGSEGASVSKFTRMSDIRLVGYRFFNDSARPYYEGIRIQNILGFRVDHCNLQDICGNGIHATGTSNPSQAETHYMIQGVIDHCRLVNTKGICAGYDARTLGYGVYVTRGSGYQYEYKESNISKILGQYLNYTVFVEDCYLEKWRHCIVSRHGGHAVFRHSMIQYNYGYGCIDQHGDECSRAIEVYENTLLDAITGGGGSEGEGIWMRGGGGVVFNNSIDNLESGIYDYFLILSNEGGEYGLTHDVWAWNNTVGEGIVNYSTSGGNPPIEDIDYFLREPNVGDDGFTYTPYPYPHPLTFPDGNGNGNGAPLPFGSVALRTFSNNAVFYIDAPVHFYIIEINMSQTNLLQSYSYRKYTEYRMFVSSPNDVNFSITRWFPVKNSEAKLTINSPLSTNISLTVYSPNFIRARASGVVSQLYYEENQTLTMIANSDTSLIITITAMVTETVIPWTDPLLDPYGITHIMMFIGFGGFGLMIFSPLLFVAFIKDEKHEYLIIPFFLFCVGLALVVGWLWG